MLLNYLKTAVRSISKDKQHFLLNLVGFSIGIAAATLMALFAQYELSYDKQQPDSERVYLAHTDYRAVGLQQIASSRYSITETLKNHNQVEEIFKLSEAGMLFSGANELVKIGDNSYRLDNFYVATSNILNFISLQPVMGDIEQALSEPNQLLLSEKEAKRLFGDTQVVGKTLNYEGGQYRVGAIFRDIEENTHFKFDSLKKMPADFETRGYGFAYYKLMANTDIASFEQYFSKVAYESFGEKGNPAITNKLVKLQNMHLEGVGPFYMKKPGSSSVLQICISLSFILILVASINFINLNIAQSAKRAKEVGVRKALGATKRQIIAQFLTESLLVVACASILAFTLVELSLPHFNQMMDRQLYLDYGSIFMMMVFTVIFIVGLLSGLYPAFFIASFSAKRVLSGDLVRGGTAIFIRKLTLCFQGALSIGLIIAATSLYQQISLINTLQVGYDKSSRLVVKELPSSEIYQKENNNLLAAIGGLPGVEQVTLSNTDLTSDMEYDFKFTWPNGEKVEGFQPTVGSGFYAVETLGLTLLAGRDFSPEFGSDWFSQDDDGNSTIGILVSRRMVDIAGYPTLESVIGLTLFEPRYNLTAKVVGVVENVKIGSARQQSLPVSFNLGHNQNNSGHIVIKAGSSDVSELTQQVRELIERELHLNDVQIDLMAQDYANAHENENRALDMVTIFSLFAIFLTCLGTFGLASFATIRRQKEVAMRKVLGASRVSIVNLLAKEFLLLVGGSILLAYPISYWLIGEWLANFNDRIEQAASVYLMSASIIAVITWLTVAILGFKAASMRPSLILRYE